MSYHLTKKQLNQIINRTASIILEKGKRGIPEVYQLRDNPLDYLNKLKTLNDSGVKRSRSKRPAQQNQRPE